MAHINEWGLENRYIYCHVVKKIPANWKLNMEAFMEAYHVIHTHPQVAVTNADANSQYDVYGEHVNRFISSLGVLSPHLRASTRSRTSSTSSPSATAPCSAVRIAHCPRRDRPPAHGRYHARDV
jgi:hypothetical protein